MNGAMLLYLSADGSFSTVKHPQDCEFVFICVKFLAVGFF